MHTCDTGLCIAEYRIGLTLLLRVGNSLFRSCRSLCNSLQKERCEQIALVTLFKKATRAKWADCDERKSLSMRAISSRRSLQKERFAPLKRVKKSERAIHYFLVKKTSNLHKEPKSEFLTLSILHLQLNKIVFFGLINVIELCNSNTYVSSTWRRYYVY